MKRIGILTHYYRSKNYGGNLQAYALCEFLNKSGFKAEQICYNGRLNRMPEPIDATNGSALGKIKKAKELIFSKGIIAFLKLLRERALVKRDLSRDFYDKKAEAFKGFNSGVIPHSKVVYDEESVSNCVSDYDIFIVGSDQVWNLRWYHPVWFLSFVPASKKKISYAASMAMEGLSDEEKKMIAAHLGDYAAVSVRERRSVELLKEISSIKPQYVIDPVMLLNREDWDQVCEERLIKDKYLFCYFLGDNKKERELAQKFAKKNKLKLVHIPFAAGVDLAFGDKRLIDVTPEQFIALIKYAEYIFTDSFHATVFSHIYQKQYFIFNRSKKGEMSSRITDITDLFGTTERFCVGEEKEGIKYIENLSNIDYSKQSTAVESLKEKSIKFILENLGE